MRQPYEIVLYTPLRYINLSTTAQLRSNKGEENNAKLFGGWEPKGAWEWILTVPVFPRPLPSRMPGSTIYRAGPILMPISCMHTFGSIPCLPLFGLLCLTCFQFSTHRFILTFTIISWIYIISCNMEQPPCLLMLPMSQMANGFSSFTTQMVMVILEWVQFHQKGWHSVPPLYIYIMGLSVLRVWDQGTLPCAVPSSVGFSTLISPSNLSVSKIVPCEYIVQPTGLASPEQLLSRPHASLEYLQWPPTSPPSQPMPNNKASCGHLPKAIVHQTSSPLRRPPGCSQWSVPVVSIQGPAGAHQSPGPRWWLYARISFLQSQLMSPGTAPSGLPPVCLTGAVPLSYSFCHLKGPLWSSSLTSYITQGNNPPSLNVVSNRQSMRGLNHASKKDNQSRLDNLKGWSILHSLEVHSSGGY